MLWIALAAAQIHAPVPQNRKALFAAGDFPASVAARLRTGFWQVGVQLTIRPDGSIQSCDISATSGVAELDRRSCDILHQRGRFAAASLNSVPAYGVYRTTIGWALSNGPPPGPPPLVGNPDMELLVQSLPAGFKSPVSVRVMFAVDSVGRLSSCTAEPGPSLEHAVDAPALVPVACEQLMQAFRPNPVKDASGNAIPSIQDAVVRFSVAH